MLRSWTALTEAMEGRFGSTPSPYMMPVSDIVFEVSALGSPVRNWCLIVAHRGYRSRDGAISLEALVIAEGVV
jgi:hypothetical protein